MKNKISFILILAIAMFFFPSCQQEDGADIPSPNDVSLNEDVDSAKYIKTNADFYDDYLLMGSDMTFVINLNTLEKTPFCNKPNCLHNNSSCLAKNAKDNPIIYNDFVFYFNSASNVIEDKNTRRFVISSKLMKTSLSSFESEVLCEFTDCMPNKPSYYVLKDNILYFTGNDMNPVMDEYGGISTSNAGGYHFLCCINLDTGEYKNLGSIYDGDKVYEMAGSSSGANITGVYQNKMYIQYVYMKESPDVLGIAPEENWTRVNFEYDFDTKELLESSLPAALYMDSDTYAYLDNKSKETVVIKKEAIYHVPHYDLSTMALKIINNKAFFTNEWYDLSDMSKHSYGEYNNYEVVAYYNNFYILVNGGGTAKITEEELLAL